VSLTFYKVKVTLEPEMKVREVLGSGLAARAQDLPLPTRAKLGLQRANILTLASLLTTPPDAILQIRGLGAKSLQAIRELHKQFVPE
jgi:DNA-directed RNA polymerase alpha subunit